MYVPGSWVWLSTRDLRLRLPCRKLSPRYVGPFKIIWIQGTTHLIIDGEEAYEVQEILDSQRWGGLLQYLATGRYGPEERSCVDAKDILEPSLTTDFHRTHPNKLAPRSRGIPRRRGGGGGGGAVMNPASVVPPDRHQRSSSPEY